MAPFETATFNKKYMETITGYIVDLTDENENQSNIINDYPCSR